MPDRGTSTGTVRAVIFDVDGTLYRQRPVRRAMARKLAGAYWRRPRAGLRTARILSAYRHAHEALRDAPAGDDLRSAQAARAAATAGVDPAAVTATVAEWMESAPLGTIAAHARPGLADGLAALRRAGIKLGVVSDYPALAKLQALGVDAAFDVVVAAQDAGVQALKPNPRGIQFALRELGVDACHAVYVGDRHDVDVAAAAAAGVRCVIIGAAAPDGAGDAAGVADVADVEQLVELVSGWA